MFLLPQRRGVANRNLSEQNSEKICGACPQRSCRPLTSHASRLVHNMSISESTGDAQQLEVMTVIGLLSCCRRLHSFLPGVPPALLHHALIIPAGARLVSPSVVFALLFCTQQWLFKVVMVFMFLKLHFLHLCTFVCF